MNATIRYLNTDLNLTSASDLTELAEALAARGVPPLHVSYEESLWSASFETDIQYDQPESTIAAMLDVLEALEPSLQAVWLSCTQRDFDIGYDCGNEPWAFNQRLSNQLLNRMVALGASLCITLYPPDPGLTPDIK